MKDTLVLALFQAGDANFTLQKYDEAISCYHRAKEVSLEIAHLLYAFNADASEIVTIWETGDESEDDLLKMLRSTLGNSKGWSETPDSNMMRNVRRTVLEDPRSNSDLCIFFDGEKNFECRVERTGLRKECFGNLYWKGGLCPYFKEFMIQLEK